MPTTTVLDRATRDLLWRDLVGFVFAGDLKDITHLLERNEGQKAMDSAQRLRNGMRLMDDLGWDRIDDRPEYRVTMPARAFRELVSYLAQEAEQTSAITRATMTAGRICR